MRENTGTFLTANSQPENLPGVTERWPFIKKIHDQFNVIKFVQMIGSLGCPFSCDFCIDSEFLIKF